MIFATSSPWWGTRSRVSYRILNCERTNKVLTNSHLITGILISALGCLCATKLFSRLAKNIGFVDRPDIRKQHLGEIPVVGGLAIYFSVLAVVLFLNLSHIASYPVLVGSMLVLIGAVDDRKGLSPLVRIPVQAFAAVCMMYLGQMSIESVGNITGLGAVLLSGGASIAFTIICTVGVINSINMIDGVDGLSGTIIFLTYIPLSYFSWVAGDFDSVILLISFQAAIVAFLFFNARVFRSRASVFLGDAGSMFLGLILVWFLIRLTQGADSSLSPVAAGWIFGLPLVDTISVMVARVLARRSPFSADRTHLHHKLLDSGLSVNQTVLIMAGIHILFIIFAILGNTNDVYEPVLFWSFVAIVVAHYFYTDRWISSLSSVKAPRE